MGKLRQLRGLLLVLKPRLAWLNEDKAAESRARDRTIAWRAWYKTQEWRRLRWAVLVRDLFTCQMCGRIEADTSKLVGDHKVPHKGDRALFFDAANVQCLCKACHDRTKQREERAGYQSRPDWLRPSLVPVVIVAGPPGSGKSTWVAANAGPDDLVIDLDVIACRIEGAGFRHDWNRAHLGEAMRQRNELLGDLSRPSRWPRAWFIVTAPGVERAWWRNTLGSDRVVVIAAPVDRCLSQMQAQGRRITDGARESVKKWWRDYQPLPGDEIVGPTAPR